MFRRIVFLGLGVLVALVVIFSVAALLYQNNPQSNQEPAWDSPQTRALAVTACFDCHSNQTRWPWFTRVPPGSWLAVFDTVRGRRALNFSDWNARQARRGRESAEQIREGKMPPATYLLMHSEAQLSTAEQQQLIQGLQASLR